MPGFRRIAFRWPGCAAGAVTSSWDDGTKHDRRLVEIFRAYGFKGSFYLNSSSFSDCEGGNEGCIASGEIRSLYEGFEIGSHSATHPRLWTLPPEAVFAEMVEDRRLLESLAGGIITGFVFPFGRGPSGEWLVALAKRAGFLYARRSHPAKVHEPPGDFLNWDPSCHCGSDLGEQWESFASSDRPDRLFNVWGHSYEFEDTWGWEHIENFVAKAAATPGLWFATHREVYDYVSAWRALRFSIDLGIAHNPRAQKIFLSVDGRELEIGPGETVCL